MGRLRGSCEAVGGTRIKEYQTAEKQKKKVVGENVRSEEKEDKNPYLKLLRRRKKETVLSI